MQTVFERIEEYNKALSAPKVGRKYKLLLDNPFRFFRGTNHLFYEDLSKAMLPASPACWICGDLHLENFGTYKADNRLVYFDLNDFDESILAPVAWELARVVTSILLAFDSLKITGEQSVSAAKLFLDKYAKVLAAGKPRYIEARTATGMIKKLISAVEARTPAVLLKERTTLKKGKLVLNHKHKKLLALDKASRKELKSVFEVWMNSNNMTPNHYRILDINFRLAGTGSVGIQRYVFLIEKIAEPGKCMLVDMKQATTSSLANYVKIEQPAWKSEADRMVTIQHCMQNIPPAQLSCLQYKDDFYLMQEMQPTKDRISFDLIQDQYKNVCAVLEDMAMLTASAHLRTVSRLHACSADELISFGKQDDWQGAVLNYARNYKNQVIADYNDFTAAYQELKKERLALKLKDDNKQIA